MDTEARATTIGITYDLTCTASSWGPGGQHETSPMSAYTDSCLVEQHGMAVLISFLESRAWGGPSDPCCQVSVGEALPAQLWRPAHRHRAGQRGQSRDQGKAPGGRAICIWRCGATRTWTTGARLVASLTDHFLHIGGIKVCARQHLRLENAPICFYLLIRRTLLRRFLRSPRGSVRILPFCQLRKRIRRQFEQSLSHRLARSPRRQSAGNAELGGAVPRRPSPATSQRGLRGSSCAVRCDAGWILARLKPTSARVLSG